MNANFLQEMTAVQEAFDMWKTNHYDDSKIPTNGIVQSKDIVGNGRLYGEIAYYRKWSESENNERPEKDVLNKNCFDDYQGDLIVVPRGVEDLFYLNNEEIGIKNDNVYIIDAVNSMIYKIKGYTIKSVDVHSLAMYREVTGGNVDVRFASAEVEGSGDNIKYAGEEYYKDKDGNYVDENGNIVDEDHKVKNPYGFKLIADYRSNNIYKLYNNGELYGKGVKGTQLNTSPSEMEKIDSTKFSELIMPSQIKNCKKIINGYNALYYIDGNNELWAIGPNSKNKFGLTEEQQNEYTGREVIKLNVNNKKVDMCWDLCNLLYVRTIDNELYSVGGDAGDLISRTRGDGKDEIVNSFTKIKFEHPENIKYAIYLRTGNNRSRVILVCKDNKFWGIGWQMAAICGTGEKNDNYISFVPIFDGNIYEYNENNKSYEVKSYNASGDIDQDIKKICINIDIVRINILKKDGTVWYATGGKLVGIENLNSGVGVEDIYTAGQGLVFLQKDGKVFATTVGDDPVGMGKIGVGTPTQLTLPEDLESEGIKEIYSRNDTIYYLSNQGKVYGSSSTVGYLGTKNKENKIILVEDKIKMSSFYDGIFNDPLSVGIFDYGVIVCIGKDGKKYSIGNKDILFGDSVLEKDWKKVADNLIIKKVFLGENNSIAVINDKNELYVAGEDGRRLGLGISTLTQVNNLTKVEDSLIDGKVKEVSFTMGCMYVLTTEGDLYASGIFSTNGSNINWPYGTHPGWSEKKDNYSLVKIELPKAESISSIERDVMVVTEEGIYTWGANYYNSYLEMSYVPVKSKINNDFNKNDIRKIGVSMELSVILKNDGSIFLNGGCLKQVDGYLGVNFGNNCFENKNSSFDGKAVENFSICDRNAAYFITDDGALYGYGYKKLLGIGDISDGCTDIIQKLKVGEKDNEVVTQVVAGNQCTFVVTKSGKIFATGSNIYGVLGRWIGIDRKSPNSRYKTAFEWVECPELEL